MNLSLLLKVERPEPKLITFRLLDHKKKPIPQAHLDIFAGDKEFNKLTDENGIIRLEASHFPDKQKLAWQAAFQSRIKRVRKQSKKPS